LEKRRTKIMDSKILTELTELKDKVSKIKDIFKTDLAITGQKILEKVDINTYKLTEEEKQVEQEIEEMMEFISHIVDEFYNYDEEDLDKLIIK
jgi:iron-sulfur cluster repair protein YtfE (RIC family)